MIKKCCSDNKIIKNLFALNIVDETIIGTIRPKNVTARAENLYKEVRTGSNVGDIDNQLIRLPAAIAPMERFNVGRLMKLS